VGSGIGQIFKVDKQPQYAQIAAFYSVERPEDARNLGLRLQLALLFPK
jgi:hypothetical protein